MTHDEFKSWWNDLKLRFPSVRAWIAKNAADAESQQAMLRTWRDVLSADVLADCLRVNELMQAGELEFVGEYDGDKERLPQHVRRLARQLAFERDRTQQAAELPPLGKKGSGFPAAKILLRMWELERAGADHDVARSQALEEFPVGNAIGREQRFACTACWDSGRVHVASNAAIETMLAGAFETCHHRDGVMRCFCQVGQRLSRKSNGQAIAFETYNREMDFAVQDPLWRRAERKRFAEWCASQVDRRAEELAKTHSNYEPQFADWNNR